MSSVDVISHHGRGKSMRIQSLDGLRGIAILSVLLIHHGLFNNGWMGVDLFFVLSGFLITQILRKEKGEPFYWKRFYVKRATRILPPLVLTVALGYLFTPKAHLLAAVAYLLSFSGFIELSPYHILPLGPLWSLAVEEHFYILWPFAVRYLPRKYLLVVLSVVIATVPLLRMFFSHPMPMAQLTPIYFLTPFRIDEMSFGCLLAILVESGSTAAALTRWSKWLFLLSTVTYIGIWSYFHHVLYFPGAHTKFFDSTGYTLVAVICFFAVAHVRLNRDSWASRTLSFAPLAFVGRISYGIYLYHLLVKTLVMWTTHGTSERMALIGDFPLVLFFSWLSFKYYESPIIEWGKHRADAYRSTWVSKRRSNTAQQCAPEVLSGQLAVAAQGTE
jgi:peptidoglycan/LPS O-acetylase OafA/YrhL